MNGWKPAAACLAAVTTLALAPATGAQAGPGAPEDCPDGAVCFWSEPGYQGQMSIRENPGSHCDAAPDGQIASAINLTDETIILYYRPNCAGPYIPVTPGRWKRAINPEPLSWR